jgi:hypothetical protein
MGMNELVLGCVVSDGRSTNGKIGVGAKIEIGGIGAASTITGACSGSTVKSEMMGLTIWLVYEPKN